MILRDRYSLISRLHACCHLMPRLHQRNKLRATSCADEQLVTGNKQHVARIKLLVARNKLLVTRNKLRVARNLLLQVTCCAQHATCCAQQATSCAQLVTRNLLRWCKRSIRDMRSAANVGRRRRPDEQRSRPYCHLMRDQHW